ncbi:MAG: AzlC family ABC transporter permease [Ruminococcus sp.]|nr:AzlC family ABC transporter permease [Ruminococcus sp.]
MLQSSRSEFFSGIKDSIPIALGYVSVSFGFGIMAVSAGLSIWAAVIISMANLTSAGQVAGLSVITGGGTLVEMAIAQFIINLRYSLMSISLSQKLDKSFDLPARLIGSFGITDEVFAVASGREKEVSKHYLYGLIIPPYFAWALGTLLGAAAGEVLPTMIKVSLGIAIYGMFTAIVVPAARKAVGVLAVAATAAALSCALRYIPLFSGISSGFAIIICTVAAAAAGAVLFPVKDEEGAQQ